MSSKCLFRNVSQGALQQRLSKGLSNIGINCQHLTCRSISSNFQTLLIGCFACANNVDIVRIYKSVNHKQVFSLISRADWNRYIRNKQNLACKNVINMAEWTSNIGQNYLIKYFDQKFWKRLTWMSPKNIDALKESIHVPLDL